MLTAAIVAGVNGTTVLVMVACLAAFVAHEPLLVLLGRRGQRAGRRDRRRAIRWLVAAAAVSVVAGITAVWLTSRSARWAFAVPLIPAVLYAGALAVRAERTTTGELAAALAFSLVAVPLCRVADVPLAVALAIGVSFAALSGASTLSVRVVILEVRAGGNPRAVTMTRVILTCWIASMTTALTMLVEWAALSWIALAAITPGLLVSLALALRPRSPTRLRQAGWALVSTSAAATVLLAIGMRLH